MWWLMWLPQPAAAQTFREATFDLQIRKVTPFREGLQPAEGTELPRTVYCEGLTLMFEPEEGAEGIADLHFCPNGDKRGTEWNFGLGAGLGVFAGPAHGYLALTLGGGKHPYKGDELTTWEGFIHASPMLGVGVGLFGGIAIDVRGSVMIGRMFTGSFGFDEPYTFARPMVTFAVGLGDMGGR
ncbi:MAG: hypothetical protein H6737_06105 [Alphaproteobacteria bacterium]|nr:hypothetical protein [Alphaproteobacteria bacterium]